MYDFMSVDQFIEVYNHYHNPVENTFTTPKRSLMLMHSRSPSQLPAAGNSKSALSIDTFSGHFIERESYNM